MNRMMYAAVLHGREDLRYEQVKRPAIKDNEVLVRVKAAGVCGSDIPRMLGDAAFYYPLILGHEFAGEIVGTGEKVSKVKAGDRVAGIPLLPCRSCPDCSEGHYAQCVHYSFTGSKRDGAWADFIRLPEDHVVQLPGHLSYEAGAMLEPTSVAVHALQHMGFQSSGHTLLLGMGTIGLLTLQCAKLWGAPSVTVVDLDGSKLDVARQLGADAVINPLHEPLIERGLALTDGRGFNQVLEATGATEAMKQCFELAANHARVCFIGTPHQELSFEPRLFEKMNRKQFTLTGSWMSYSAPFPGKEWELAAEYLSSGQLRIESLIERRIPLAEAGELVRLFKQPGKVKGKVLFVSED